MKTGIIFDVRNPPRWQRPWPAMYGRVLELCEGADKLGIGGLWFTEHHGFEDGYLPQPLTLAAAAAARTSRAVIGTSILIAPLRKPAQLAEEAAIVDLLSSGRLELGLGAGYREPEFRLFGEEIRERFARTASVISEVQRLWRDGLITPPPPCRGDIPIWGGFYGPKGAALAGQLGIGLLALNPSLFAPYRDALIEHGHDPQAAKVGGLTWIVLADDPDAAWVQMAPHFAYQRDSYDRYGVEGTSRPAPPPCDPESLRRPTNGLPKVAVLTPDEAAAVLRERTKGLPVSHVLFWASVAGMPDALVERNIELIADKLSPLLAGKPAAAEDGRH